MPASFHLQNSITCFEATRILVAQNHIDWKISFTYLLDGELPYPAAKFMRWSALRMHRPRKRQQSERSPIFNVKVQNIKLMLYTSKFITSQLSINLQSAISGYKFK